MLRINARPGQTWIERRDQLAADVSAHGVQPRRRTVTQLEAAADGGVDVTFSDGQKAWRTSFSAWLSWIELTGAELA
ncbi:hypothetical protein FHR90_002786 [Endobacter medicaginis]|jgi:hypothetical protein|uniref:Uncharacterized protein n=1 Tax=Endobacter medicaginis TaxID=1181271 RepID=A0A850NR16_9PROT|nr:hypothetical protein [Endobacter medicaginis]MBB3174939.1 hypothetical protein [Endobacter medicaginis]MCX5476400.1 hypothetical protein [Endobacter medicaginis]NVN31344.1 hypothetical protein [Endobacter medicaginis]